MFDGAERAIHAAQEIGQAVAGIGLKIRAAVHTGESELQGVYASWATRELLAGSPIGFADRGLRELKGLSEGRRVYLVERSG